MTKRSRNEGECPVCYVDLGESPEECVHCKTSFHKDCVREWHKYQPELKAGPITVGLLAVASSTAFNVSSVHSAVKSGENEARQDTRRQSAALEAGRHRPRLLINPEPGSSAASPFNDSA